LQVCIKIEESRVDRRMKKKEEGKEYTLNLSCKRLKLLTDSRMHRPKVTQFEIELTWSRHEYPGDLLSAERRQSLI